MTQLTRQFVVRSIIPANQLSQRLSKSIRCFPQKQMTRGKDSLVFRSCGHSRPRRRQNRRKFNSTDTMFIENDLHQPDMDMIIRCISRAIAKKVSEGCYTSEKKLLCLFEEEFRPPFKFTNLFDVANVFLFMVFESVGLCPEIAVISVVYVDRLLEATKLTFNMSNWRRIVFTAILLSAKAWEELAVWNEDFSNIFPGWISLSTLSLMERQFLKHIKFDLGIQSSVYTNYYLQLRSYADVSEDFPVAPRDQQTMTHLKRNLENRKSKNRVTLHRSRCSSMDSWEKDNGEVNVVNMIQSQRIQSQRYKLTKEN